MKRFIVPLFVTILLTGCSTLENKDVSLRVRSPVADVNYDSRVSVVPVKSDTLPELEVNGIERIK